MTFSWGKSHGLLVIYEDRCTTLAGMRFLPSHESWSSDPAGPHLTAWLLELPVEERFFLGALVSLVKR